jgi:hypothetical protein
MLAIVREHLANPAVDHRLGFRLDCNKDMPAILLLGTDDARRNPISSAARLFLCR